MNPDHVNQRLEKLGKSRYWLANQVQRSGAASTAAVYQYLKGWYKRPSYELISGIDSALRDAEKTSGEPGQGG